ncbi:WRKY transcription factor 23-like [Senna tora]|uniref:WRKY transcription factor 23-like n=1 Tax=Senna tora TaxID=362788 RepID=A0A834SWQ8_9FABA|nr:WRKY transcription factor 23-like [Senna tora]
MERKEEGIGWSSFGGYNNSNSFTSALVSSTSGFEFEEMEKRSLGFMELLEEEQHYTPALLDLDLCANNSATAKDCSEALNQQPPTPNSSSISSASSEALIHDDHTITPQPHPNTNKLLKVKKTKQKKQREPRFAFMTKSEVDHLEDGYRWRKYGQKAVKNSPFPSASCNVKKRVERSYSDPSIVVTTYEGQHTHPSPIMPRSVLPAPSSLPPVPLVTSPNYLHHQHLLLNTFSSFTFPFPPNHSTSNTNNNMTAFHDTTRRPCHPGTTAFLSDHGLLQDIIPSHMLKQE